MSEGETIQSLTQLDRNTRKLLLDHLRSVQKISNALKGIAGDRAIVQKYGVDDWPDVELDPSSPQDVESIMEDIEDNYKQIKLCRNKIRGRGSANLRDSGISECSERLSQLSHQDSTLHLSDFELSEPVENEESHDERVLQEQAEASLSARSRRSGTRRQIAEETEPDREVTETQKTQLND